MEYVPVGILGATGAIGQRFVALLHRHPRFRVSAVVASGRSAGKLYKDAVNWRLESPLPSDVGDMVVLSMEEFVTKLPCKMAFSALDSSVAQEIEMHLRSKGCAVFSTASANRQNKDVPILIPFVNPAHLQLAKIQHRSTPGFIITNANCTSVGLCVVLQAISSRFIIDQVLLFSMQALSGAGYPGVASLDVCDNVLPYIQSEEDKLADEPRKILGIFQDDSITPAPMVISAHCNRVGVSDGHTECISIRLRHPDGRQVTDKTEAAKEVKECLREYTIPTDVRGALLSLPNPDPPIHVCDQDDRPQPRLDRNYNNGYGVSAGRIRPCAILDVKVVLVVHNTVLGGAGGSLLNAELALKNGYIPL